MLHAQSSHNRPGPVVRNLDLRFAGVDSRTGCDALNPYFMPSSRLCYLGQGRNTSLTGAEL